LQFIDDYTDEDFIGLRNFMIETSHKSSGMPFQRQPSNAEIMIKNNIEMQRKKK